MTCKNCEAALRTDFMYCPGCGAKVAANRLTFKGLFSDMMERFFDLDNSFYRTLKTMTVRPEVVIGGYIEGLRRRFLNPMSYLGLVLGLSGFLFFVLKKYAADKIDWDVFGMGTNQASVKILDATMEYSSFIFLLYIPLIAIAGILTFNQRNYNLPEHFVSAIYTLAHVSIITFPISLGLLFLMPELYMQYSLAMIAAMVGFALFVLIRLHKYSLGITLVRGFLFLILMLGGYFAISIAVNIILLLTGVVTLEDFKPQ
jgi:hypothetical protein